MRACCKPFHFRTRPGPAVGEAGEGGGGMSLQPAGTVSLQCPGGRGVILSVHPQPPGALRQPLEVRGQVPLSPLHGWENSLGAYSGSHRQKGQNWHLNLHLWSNHPASNILQHWRAERRLHTEQKQALLTSKARHSPGGLSLVEGLVANASGLGWVRAGHQMSSGLQDQTSTLLWKRPPSL